MTSLRALGLALLLFPSGARAADAVGKVLVAYPDKNTTKMIIEARQALVIGNNVFAGPDEVMVTLGDLLSQKDGLFYYSGSFPGKADIKPGDAVATQKTRTIATPSPLVLKIKESYTFDQKRKGEVTAVQDGRAMIDRGTLHEVHERDVYRVYGPDGRYKGKLEVRGIGDLQSSGELYNGVEDRRRDALKTAPGDRVVFAGQRKLTALGLVGGVSAARKQAFGAYEQSLGAGLLWSVTFRDGWSAETLFGYYGRHLYEAHEVGVPHAADYLNESLGRDVKFICPTWLKKSFFFPSVVSPFVAAGLSVITAELNLEKFGRIGGLQRFPVRERGKPVRIIPVLGAGVEFFPGRLIRPRLELRWFDGPTVKAGPETFETESTFLSLGLFTAW